MEVHHKYRLVDLQLCQVCRCKLHRGIKAKGIAVKLEPPCSCIFYADKFLLLISTFLLMHLRSTLKCFALCALKPCTCSCGKRAEESLQVLCSAMLGHLHIAMEATCKACKWFLLSTMQLHMGLSHMFYSTAHHRPL